MEHRYYFSDSGEVITPALIYYKDIIRENIQKAVKLAGGASRLWPHVKSHKMTQMMLMQMDEGITRYKCATIAEAEMAADCGAAHVLLAYPLVGPNIHRFLQLQRAYPSVCFWAIGDDKSQLELLGKSSAESGIISQILIDVNMGMDRTGISPDQLEDFYLNCSKIPGLQLRGFHCYDGQRTENLYEDRKQAARETSGQITQIRAAIIQKGLCADTVVLGGSPSFPCHLDFTDAYFSPGTIFINDYGYYTKFPDLDFTPGAAVLTRVISCPKKGHFTLDLGYKGIASDPVGMRGFLVGLHHVTELFQSEEHWAFRMNHGFESECPKIGDQLFVIPTHICPTSALYPSVIAVSDRQAPAIWEVTARNRKITY